VISSASYGIVPNRRRGPSRMAIVEVGCRPAHQQQMPPVRIGHPRWCCRSSGRDDPGGETHSAGFATGQGGLEGYQTRETKHETQGCVHNRGRAVCGRP